jgi:hypothetical protein
MQRRIASTVLSRLGFNKHMPRQVVFSTKSKGGIGLLNLPSEQGSSQIQLIISHLRSKSYLYDTIKILLESYQLIAGCQESPLINTQPHHHLHSPWVQSLREFLRSINGTIYVPDLAILHKHRVNDKPIMQYTQHSLTKSDLECINACRLFLQVTYLSEISDDKGTSLLTAAIKGSVHKNGIPVLWDTSNSKLQWPLQPRPPQKSWAKWKTYLRTITSPTFNIQPALGQWLASTYIQRNWRFSKQNNLIIERTESTYRTLHQTLTRTRNSKTYLYNPMITTEWTDSCIPVIPHKICNDKIVCSSNNQLQLVTITEENQAPSFTYHCLVLDAQPPGSEIDITYTITHKCSSSVATAIISIDNMPYAITTYDIPVNTNNTTLTFDAYGCVLPLLLCSSRLTPPLKSYHLQLHCNTKQIATRIIRTTLMSNPTTSYRPEWDLLVTIKTEFNKFHSPKVTTDTQANCSFIEQYQQLIHQLSAPQNYNEWPTMTSSYPVAQLQINSRRTPSNYTLAVREAHTTPAIFSYYMDKYDWDSTTTENIL